MKRSIFTSALGFAGFVSLSLFSAPSAEANVRKIDRIMQNDDGSCTVVMSIGRTQVRKDMSCEKAERMAVQQARGENSRRNSRESCRDSTDAAGEIAGTLFGSGAERAVEEASDVACD